MIPVRYRLVCATFLLALLLYVDRVCITSLAFPYLLAWTGNVNVFFITGAVLNVLAAGAWLMIRPDRPWDETRGTEIRAQTG